MGPVRPKTRFSQKSILFSGARPLFSRNQNSSVPRRLSLLCYFCYGFQQKTKHSPIASTICCPLAWDQSLQPAWHLHPFHGRQNWKHSLMGIHLQAHFPCSSAEKLLISLFQHNHMTLKKESNQYIYRQWNSWSSNTKQGSSDLIAKTNASYRYSPKKHQMHLNFSIYSEPNLNAALEAMNTLQIGCCSPK